MDTVHLARFLRATVLYNCTDFISIFMLETCSFFLHVYITLLQHTATELVGWVVTYGLVWLDWGVTPFIQIQVRS